MHRIREGLLEEFTGIAVSYDDSGNINYETAIS